MIYGHAGISTDDQSVGAQVTALTAAEPGKCSAKWIKLWL
jgi:hypothetical protein